MFSSEVTKTNNKSVYKSKTNLNFLILRLLRAKKRDRKLYFIKYLGEYYDNLNKNSQHLIFVEQKA